MRTLGRRSRDGRVLGLVLILGLVLVGCAETRSEIATSLREGRIAQQHYDAGKAKYRARDYAAAVPLFQRTLAHDPQYDDAEIYLAWSYFPLGQYGDATQHLRQV